MQTLFCVKERHVELLMFMEGERVREIARDV